MSNKTVLILGARSDMAQALAYYYAKKGWNIQLAARNAGNMENIAQNIRIRYQVEATLLEFDAIDYFSHYDFYRGLPVKPDGVICAVGFLGEQKRAEQQFDETKKIMETNYLGPVSILNIVANDFEQRKGGFIVGISSVAGDRGRQSNYIYGSAKAAFSTYLSGLRNRLHAANVTVLTVKPGFVNTAMTKGMNLPKRLTAEPEEVARDIYNAQQSRKDVIYTKWFWSPIMSLIKNLPEKVFKKTKM